MCACLCEWVYRACVIDFVFYVFLTSLEYFSLPLELKISVSPLSLQEVICHPKFHIHA